MKKWMPLSWIFGRRRTQLKEDQERRKSTSAQHIEAASLSQIDWSDIDQRREMLRVPCVLLNKTPKPDEQGAKMSWLGGLPTLPSDIPWPWYAHRGKDVVPMHFHGQFNLAELGQIPELPDMPKTGTLLFFHTPVVDGLLSDGVHIQNCKVIHVRQDLSHVAERAMPTYPDLGDLPLQSEPWDLYFEETRRGPYDRWNVDYLKFDTFDCGYSDPLMREALQIWEDISQSASDRLRGQTKEDNDEPALHHFFGANTTGAAGNNKTTHIQLLSVSNDIDLDNFDYAGSWVTYWITKDDLANGNFDKVFVSVEG